MFSLIHSTPCKWTDTCRSNWIFSGGLLFPWHHVYRCCLGWSKAGVHTGRASRVTATGARGFRGSGGSGRRTQRHGQDQETKHAGLHVEFGVDSVMSSRPTAMTVLIFSEHKYNRIFVLRIIVHCLHTCSTCNTRLLFTISNYRDCIIIWKQSIYYWNVKEV